MTQEQYDTYTKVSEEIKSVKDFLEQGCGLTRNKYQSCYLFRLIVKERHEKKLFFMRKWHACRREENEFEIPQSLQRDLAATAERWLKEREEFLQNI